MDYDRYLGKAIKSNRKYFSKDTNYMRKEIYTMNGAKMGRLGGFLAPPEACDIMTRSITSELEKTTPKNLDFRKM